MSRLVMLLVEKEAYSFSLPSICGRRVGSVRHANRGETVSRPCVNLQRLLLHTLAFHHTSFRVALIGMANGHCRLLGSLWFLRSPLLDARKHKQDMRVCLCKYVSSICHIFICYATAHRLEHLSFNAYRTSLRRLPTWLTSA